MGNLKMKSLYTLLLTILASMTVAGCYSMFNSQSSSSTAPPTTTPKANTMPAGTMASGTLSGSTGSSMDSVDRAKLNQALETNRTGQGTSWTNPSSKVAFSVTPTRTFNSPTGDPCRDFTTASTNGAGQSNTVYGTACRDGAGQWHIVSS